MYQPRGSSRDWRAGSLRRSQASSTSSAVSKNSPVSSTTYFQPPMMCRFTRMVVFTHSASTSTRGDASCTFGAMSALRVLPVPQGHME